MNPFTINKKTTASLGNFYQVTLYLFHQLQQRQSSSNVHHHPKIGKDQYLEHLLTR